MSRPPAPSRLIAAGRQWLANSISGRGYRRIREIDLDTHALALAAQQLLCTAPLIVAMGAVLQRTTGRGAGYYMTRFFGLHGSSASAVRQLFGRTSASITTPELVFWMIVAVVFTASVAAVQQRAFELIWTLPRKRGVRSYLRQFAWAVMLGGYSAAVLVTGQLGKEIVETFGRPGLFAIGAMQGVLTFIFFWWSQRWLLGGRVTWRALLPGALAVGLLTSVLFRLTRVVMPGQISWQVNAYGLVGAVFVLSVWVMILSVLVFGGVLFGALVTERRAEKKAAKSQTDVDVLADSPLTLAGLSSAADHSTTPVIADRH